MHGGRGGGRGRGRGRGFPANPTQLAAQEFAKDKQGPVREDPPLYPFNPTLSREPKPFSDYQDGEKLLVFARSLQNFWTSSVFRVTKEQDAATEIETWASRKAQTSNTKCNRLQEILAISDRSVFPEELLQESLARSREQMEALRKRKLEEMMGKKGAINYKDLEDREREAEKKRKEAGGEKALSDADLFASDDDDGEFGDGDYAFNHYDHLERDDDSDPGGDGGGDHDVY
uniref:DNA-directed RNA polymerase III subunit n=1 Tax=Chromera velia CCMP2878 TaxID=1169474 RepID=A0A0G4FAE7_9ALVE|eukprot:Cvel_15871.t1-p1 / transcript=Cvel_15871.t1 / gene=Cvel_15871 / organism=Chromera_velia_CCMP2878 / gene_product=hypothetical protein / transcript_product=hypothetical protein / location=Cvel_scaffold1197:31837-33878(-) / protein_length=230 / sequence_SO=supercontig / SO=protein_coding / is_pseudo=false